MMPTSTTTILFTPRTIEQIFDLVKLGDALVQSQPAALGQRDVLTEALVHITEITAIHRPESERLPIELVTAIAAYVYGGQGGHRFDRDQD
jgi:hypothetical protein